jgi:hypothetical protein
MDAIPKVSADCLASLPPEVIALLHLQAEQIRKLTARVAELEAKLGKNPNNSSKPPSSTHPHDKPPPTKPKSKRARWSARTQQSRASLDPHRRVPSHDPVRAHGMPPLWQNSDRP